MRDSSKRRWASATTTPISWGLTPRWTVWVLSSCKCNTWVVDDWATPLENPLEKDPFSKSREPLLTGFIETKVLPCASLMAKGLPWLSLRVLLLTLCPVEEADELLLPAPATIAGTSMESGDKFRSDELGSVGPDQHPTPIALFTRISEAECSLAEKWYTDIWIDPTTTQSNSNLLETSSENEVINWRMFETNGLFGTYRMLSN